MTDAAKSGAAEAPDRADDDAAAETACDEAEEDDVVNELLPLLAEPDFDEGMCRVNDETVPVAVEVAVAPPAERAEPEGVPVPSADVAVSEAEVPPGADDVLLTSRLLGLPSPSTERKLPARRRTAGLKRFANFTL